MSNIVIFGTGQFSEVVSVYLERDSEHEIVGYTIDAEYMHADNFRGRKVVAWDKLETAFEPQDVLLFGPISYRQANRFRRDRYLEGKKRGYNFLTFIHPATFIYTDDIGENCLILENNIVQPFASIGNNVIMWSGNHIGHHSKVGDHCFITSQVGISGNTTVGERTFLGGQSGVVDGVSIGAGCIIGAGSKILRNVPDNSVVMFKGTKTISGKVHRFEKAFLG